MRSLSLVAVLCLVLAACGGDSGGGSGGGSGDAGHAGLYKLDKAAMRQMVIDGVKKQMGIDTIPPEGMAELEKEMAKAKVDMTLKADGTWTVDGFMGGETMSESGTYTVSGTTINFVTTKKDGKDAKDEKAGKLEGGVISIKPDESMPGDIRLVRE